MSGNFSISVCIPALDEEKTLNAVVEDLISNLSSEAKELDIIIVDDGSTDSTSKIADEIKNKYYFVKVIHHQKNLGIGKSFRDALAIATGDYFFCFPADGEDKASCIKQFLPYLDKSTAVTCHHREYDRRSRGRRLISKIYTSILNKIFNMKLKYYNGTTVFPTKTLQSVNLVSCGFFVFAESLIKMASKGTEIKEISVPIAKREHGKSKALTLFSLSQIIGDLIKVKWISKSYGY